MGAMGYNALQRWMQGVVGMPIENTIELPHVVFILPQKPSQFNRFAKKNCISDMRMTQHEFSIVILIQKQFIICRHSNKLPNQMSW